RVQVRSAVRVLGAAGVGGDGFGTGLFVVFRRPGAVEDQLLAADRVRIGHRHPLGVVRSLPVRETLAVVQRPDGFRVVLVSQATPDLLGLGGAVALLDGELRDGGPDLVSPARAELFTDHGREHHEVGEFEGFDLPLVGNRVDVPGDDVLAGEVTPVVGLFDVGVDPVDV